MNPIDRWFPRIVLAAALVVCGFDCSAEAQPAQKSCKVPPGCKPIGNGEYRCPCAPGSLPWCGGEIRRCQPRCAEKAQPARVEAETVCVVHRVVSHRKPLRPETCATIADAMNDTDEPVRMLALAVNESGTRPEAIRVHVRPDGLVAYDTGILQVRCLVDPARKDTACLNGPAKGLTVKRLLSVSTNIRTAWVVYEMHGRDPARFNGATGKRAKRYRQRIEAIEAALMGLPFVAPDKRTTELCRRITKAINERKQS